MARRKPKSSNGWDWLIDIGIRVAVGLFGQIISGSGGPSPGAHGATANNSARPNSEAQERKPRSKKPPRWWKVLGVRRDATREQIKLAYRELVSLTHPDKVAHLSSELQEVAGNRTKELNAAYEAALKECSGE